MPSITCEKCFHQQSEETTDDAVLNSLMTLNAYLLAVLNDLEIQYGTIRSKEVSAIVCVLGLGFIFGMLGMGFWVMCLVLPWALGCWQLWGFAGCVIAKFINNMAVSPPGDEVNGNSPSSEKQK
jgi:hypothetical protein